MSDLGTTTAKLVLDVGEAEALLRSTAEGVDEVSESFEGLGKTGSDTYQRLLKSSGDFHSQLQDVRQEAADGLDAIAEAQETLRESQDSLGVDTEAYYDALAGFQIDQIAAQNGVLEVQDEVREQLIELTDQVTEGTITLEQYAEAVEGIGAGLIQSGVVPALDETTAATQRLGAAGEVNYNRLGTAASGAGTLLRQVPGEIGETTAELANLGTQAGATVRTLEGVSSALGFGIGGGPLAAAVGGIAAVTLAVQKWNEAQDRIPDSIAKTSLELLNENDALVRNEDLLLSQTVAWARAAEESTNFYEVIIAAGLGLEIISKALYGGERAQRQYEEGLVSLDAAFFQFGGGLQAVEAVEERQQAIIDETVLSINDLVAANKELAQSDADAVAALDLTEREQLTQLQKLLKERVEETTEAQRKAVVLYGQINGKEEERTEAIKEYIGSVDGLRESYQDLFPAETGLDALREESALTQARVNQVLEEGVDTLGEYTFLVALLGGDMELANDILSDHGDNLDAQAERADEVNSVYRDLAERTMPGYTQAVELADRALEDGTLTGAEFREVLSKVKGDLPTLEAAFAEAAGAIADSEQAVEAFKRSVQDAGRSFRNDILPTIQDAFSSFEPEFEGDKITFEDLIGFETEGLEDTSRFVDRMDSLIQGGYDALAQRLAQAPPAEQQALLDQLDISNILDVENLETQFEGIDADRVAEGWKLQQLGADLSFTLSEQANDLEKSFTPDLAKAAREEVTNLSTNFEAWSAWTGAVRGAESKGNEIGRKLGEGMERGITGSTADVTAAAAALGAAAQAALDAELEIDSPSKTAERSGAAFTEGFLGGVTGGGDTINVNVTAPRTSDPQIFGRSVGVAVRGVRG